MSGLRNEFVVRRRVRRGEPLLNVLLQLVTYKIPSVTATKCGGKTTNVSSCLFRLMRREEQLRSQVSMRATCLARDTYPNHVECHPLTPFHLEEQSSEKFREQPCHHYAPSITTFTLPTRPWTIPKVRAAVIRASSWVNRSNL
jgi:hypothetical protein